MEGDTAFMAGPNVCLSLGCYCKAHLFSQPLLFISTIIIVRLVWYRSLTFVLIEIRKSYHDLAITTREKVLMESYSAWSKRKVILPANQSTRPKVGFDKCWPTHEVLTFVCFCKSSGLVTLRG